MTDAIAKLTPWFPGYVKPVRPGVYEREGFASFTYSRWTGTRWMLSSDDLMKASRERVFVSLLQSVPWRGLAKEPK